MPGQAETSPKLEVDVPGIALEYIRIADLQFQAKHLDVTKYHLCIWERRDSVAVVLRSKACSADLWIKGSSSATRPDFEVEIRKEDHAVLHANYVR
jgi:hypothetical protein